MALKKGLRIFLGLVAVISALLLLKDLANIWSLKTYNAAIDAGDISSAALINSPHGEFARAFQHQQSGEYQQARVLYDKLGNGEHTALVEGANYNLANTFLQQALVVDIKKDPDIAVPLVELAKVAYRDLLQVNPDHWGGKYNLERALQLSPDSRTLPPEEIPGRRAPNRTVISIDPEDSLP